MQKLGKLDTLFIVDAVHDKAAWFNFGPEADTRIRRMWSQPVEYSGSEKRSVKRRLRPAGVAPGIGDIDRRRLLEPGRSSSGDRSRIARAGAPRIILPSSKLLSSVTSAPAPTSERAPIRARLSRIAPMPIRLPSPTWR